MESQTKLDEKYMSFGTLYFKFWSYIPIPSTSSFISFCLTSHHLLHKQISFLQLFRTWSNILWKNILVTNFHFLSDSTKLPTLVNSGNPLSVTKVFCCGFLNLKNVWFYIWVVVVWLLISWHKWLYVTSYPCPWIKNLSAKTTKYILKCWERSVKRKPNLSFIRVIKIYLLINVFYMYMVR